MNDDRLLNKKLGYPIPDAYYVSVLARVVAWVYCDN